MDGSAVRAFILLFQSLVNSRSKTFIKCFSPCRASAFGHNMAVFLAAEHLAGQHLRLTALGQWPTLFLPLDILFDGNSQLTDLRSLGAAQPDAIIALQNDASVPRDAILPSCYPGVWIPFAEHPKPMLCIWTVNGDATEVENRPPPKFPFPKAALPFIIQDQLTDGRFADQLERWCQWVF
jgi:hypothetical protein